MTTTEIILETVITEIIVEAIITKIAQQSPIEEGIIIIHEETLRDIIYDVLTVEESEATQGVDARE